MLKSVAGLGETERTRVETMMKAQIDLAKTVTATTGLSEDDFAKAAPAKAEIAKKAQEIAKAKSISLSAAEAEVATDPANAALFQKALEEERVH